MGAVGAGAGATVGKWTGPQFAVPGGLGIATAEADDAAASAVAVVNAVGDVVASDGSILRGSTATRSRFDLNPPRQDLPTGTVLTVVATKARLDKREVRWLAARGADGVTVSIRPAHTRYDGDVVFAVAAPADSASTDLDVLGLLATEAVARAVRGAVSATA
jgi:L-aminopeptidase/D-esterase-like protein